MMLSKSSPTAQVAEVARLVPAYCRDVHHHARLAALVAEHAFLRAFQGLKAELFFIELFGNRNVLDGNRGHCIFISKHGDVLSNS
ncbi:hypothetical protein LP414_22295 [Polaromonas sp. P1(28)-13]|nr:hypothetical protein LP414_22295 [Polaromonas sp. P1(28)-13]